MLHDPFRFVRLASWTAVLVGLLIAAPAAAGPYTQLQVLLPGESPAPGTGSGKLGTPSPQTVGAPFTVTVRACDDTWTTVATVTNSVTLTSSDASATLPGPRNLVAGEGTFTVTLNADGTFTLSADDLTDPTVPLATSGMVTAQGVQGFEFETISQKHRDAGVPFSMTIWAVDPSGNTVSAFSGDVDLKQFTSFGEGRVSPERVTFSGGTWSGNLTVYRADETSINRGNVNLEARLVGNQGVNGTSDPFVVHPGPFRRLQIVVPGQSPLPGSGSGVTGSAATQAAGEAFTVEVYSTDDYWNPVPSADVVRITSSDNITPVSGALSNGAATFNLALTTVGSQTLTVNDQSNGSIAPMTSAGIPVIASGAQQFLFDGISGPVTAGDPVPVTIRAADQSGNTIPGYNGSALLIANTGPGSITPESITFNNGTWSGNVVMRGAGASVTLTCSDYSSPPHTGTSQPIVVNPGPLAGLQVVLPGESPAGGTASGVEGRPTDQNAGTSFSLTVRAVDQFWNRVPGVNHRVGFSSTDLFAGLPPETTLVNGEIVFPATLYRAGHQTITVDDLDDGGVSSHTSSSVLVLPGSYARVLILAPGESLAPGTEEGRTGSATDQSINYSFQVHVYATDAWWNPVPGVTDVVRVTSNDPLAELPPDTPLADGEAMLNVRLSTGGFQQLTVSNVSQPLMATSTTQVRAISSGFHLEAEISPTTVQAGEPFTLLVKVTNDAGSVIQEINSSVTVQVQNASSQEPGRGTLLNTEFQLLQGQRAMAETYTFAESIVMTVTDDAGNVPAVTEVLTVLPGPPASVQLASDPTWVRGNKHATVSATVLDAYANGVPAQPVDFSLLVGTGALTAIDTETDGGGVARADFHGPRTPEVDRVRAVSGTLSAELDIETALVNPDAAGGHITNYPNPFHPGEAPTTIAYVLADNATVSLKIYTMTGALVLERDFPLGGPGGNVGLNEFQWDGRNGAGDIVASGGYIAVVNAEGTGETLHVMRRKIAVVR